MTVFLLSRTSVCPNCDYVAAELGDAGIDYKKQVMTEKHDHLIEAAKSVNLLEAPVICLPDEFGELQFVTAGKSPFALMTIKRAVLALS